MALVLRMLNSKLITHRHILLLNFFVILKSINFHYHSHTTHCTSAPNPTIPQYHPQFLPPNKRHAAEDFVALAALPVDVARLPVLVLDTTVPACEFEVILAVQTAIGLDANILVVSPFVCVYVIKLVSALAAVEAASP